MMKVGTITNCLVSTVFSEQQINFVWSFFPLFNLFSGPRDSEWSFLCHSILAFCFTSLFLLCKKYDLL